MNNQNIGSSYSLMNYDIAILLSKAFGLPIWYASMLTAPRSKNRDDSNVINYRLGSRNTTLFDILKSTYSKDEADIIEVAEYIIANGIDIRTVGDKGNVSAQTYRIGSSSYFIHKERGHYFEGLKNFVGNTGQQIVLLDPDTGIAPINQEVSKSKGSSLLLTSEIGMILGKITDDSIILIRQSLNNYFYKHEDRIKDLCNELQANVMLLADEVIQSGLFVIVRSDGTNKAIINRLQYYLSGYKSLKNSNRISLGYRDNDQITIRSIDSFEIEKQD